MKIINKPKPFIKQAEQEKLAFLRKFNRVTGSLGGETEWRYYKDKSLVWVNGKARKGQRFSSFYCFTERDYGELNKLLNEIYLKLTKLKTLASDDAGLKEVEEIMRSVIFKVNKDEKSECYQANKLYKKYIGKYFEEIFEYYQNHPFDSRECAQKWYEAHNELGAKPEFEHFSDLIKSNYLTFNTAFQFVFEYAYAHKFDRLDKDEFINFVFDTYSLSSNNDFPTYRNIPAHITKGNWSPVGEETIVQAMEILADWQQSQASEKLNPIEKACVLHCELTRIQAFPDGNHRLARLIANEYLIQSDFLPISIPFNIRKEYNAATNEAIETHEIDGLIDIFYEQEYANAREIYKCLNKYEEKIEERTM